MFPIARDGLWTFIAAQCHSLEIADPVGRFHRHRNSFASDGGGSTTCRSSGPGNICNGTISGSGIRSMFQIHQNYMRKEYCNLRGIRFPVEFFRAACWWEVSKRRTFSHARFRPSFSWSLKGERTVAHLIFTTYEFCIKLPKRTWKVASFATNKESADSGLGRYDKFIRYHLLPGHGLNWRWRRRRSVEWLDRGTFANYSKWLSHERVKFGLCNSGLAKRDMELW